MTDQEVFQSCFSQLIADIKATDEFPRPLLAHYCSIATLESILKGRELWLSNPLFMNDLEEVRFGVNAGLRIALSNSALREMLGSVRSKVFDDAMEAQYESFAGEHAFDLYGACFSMHEEQEGDDGRLSMWRSYGANGNGAALVFDVNSVSQPGTGYNGLFLGPVHCGSTQERENWLELRVQETAKYIHDQRVPTEQLSIVATALFERIKIMAIFSKHRGFSEEREWRLVYMHEHDRGKVYEQYLGYHLTPRGIEPKLKLPIDGAVPWHAQQLDISALIKRILLGPSLSNPLAKSSIGRMLELIKLPSLRDRLTASSIPLRPVAPGPH